MQKKGLWKEQCRCAKLMLVFNLLIFTSRFVDQSHARLFVEIFSKYARAYWRTGSYALVRSQFTKYSCRKNSCVVVLFCSSATVHGGGDWYCSWFKSYFSRAVMIQTVIPLWCGRISCCTADHPWWGKTVVRSTASYHPLVFPCGASQTASCFPLAPLPCSIGKKAVIYGHEIYKRTAVWEVQHQRWWACAMC